MTKPRHNVHACCSHAADVLKAAGFERVHVSLRSEAVYFKFPGRHGLLRVAAHKFRGGMIGMETVVAKLTFRGTDNGIPDVLVCSTEKIDGMIYRAIGQYMIESAIERAPNYDGKRGTWEPARSC